MNFQPEDNKITAQSYKKNKCISFKNNFSNKINLNITKTIRIPFFFFFGLWIK